MRNRFVIRLLAAAATAALLCRPVAAEVVPRPGPVSGAVVETKLGEEIAFVEAGTWRGVDVSQGVVSGDTLRTNAVGQLAVLFADRTQMRVGRNTTLVIKESGAGGTRLEMPTGAIWARAARGGTGVTIDTPAASAAIRGTDWSLSVGDDGRTTLVVMEGAVELVNPQGSVLVRQGEAATAGIGETPTKTVLVDVDDREQMQFYVSLDGVFFFVPATALPTRAALAERRRLEALPEAGLTLEERVSRAEIAYSLDGAAVAERQIAAIRSLSPSPAQSARLDLVAALIAGGRGDYAGAAALIAKARPRLDRERQALADYLGYFARALEDPKRVEPLPRPAGGGPYAALAEAYAVGFLKDMKAALAVLEEAERRWPDEALLPASRAQMALLAGDREAMRTAVDRAVAVDPDNPVTLSARANYRADMESDLEGAEADLRRALAIQPGSSTLWNSLGNVLSERDRTRAAEDAYRKAIELEPRDPIAYINLAVGLIVRHELDEALVLIDQAAALDPTLSVVDLTRGRQHLARGETVKAIEALLKGTTANPALSNALLLLAAAYYANGDDDLAAQALENAARLDPEDPVPASAEAAIAIDQFRADDAIDAAQRALRLGRARGGSYATIGANQDTGSTVGDAMRFAGLDAWGDYYGDLAFDPFTATGYFDRVLGGGVSPFALGSIYGPASPEAGQSQRATSSLVQGLLLDPLAVAGAEKRVQLVRAPFVESSVTGGFVAGDRNGFTASKELQAFQVDPVPFSLLASVEGRRTDLDYSDTDDRPISGTLFLGATPTRDDRLIAFGLFNDTKAGLDSRTQLAFPGYGESRDAQGGLGWSHSFNDRNILNLVVVGAVDDNATRFDLNEEPGADFAIDSHTETLLAAVSHVVEFGAVTLRSGLEGGTVSSKATSEVFESEGRLDTETVFGRAYVTALASVTDAIQVEAALHAVHVDRSDSRDNEDRDTRIDPRVGLAWSVFEGQTLRAIYSRETLIPDLLTLSPVGVLGIEANAAPIEIGGQAETVALRWDAEWTPSLFTSLEYQHQRFDDLSIALPGTIDSLDLDEGRIDRVSLTANLRLGGGLTAFGTVAYADSDATAAAVGYDGGMPMVPETSARLGLTFVHPSRVKATVSATWIGDRAGGVNGTELDGYVTLDAGAHWETEDGRFEVDLSVLNILDEDFLLVAPAVPGDPPIKGYGRSVIGRLTARF